MKIVYVSIFERIQLHFWAFAYGLYFIFRRFLSWAWNPNTFFSLEQRDEPPSCLTDDTFGKHSYVKIKGTKFHYVKAGSKDNPPVLLLHGFPDCWLSWRDQMQALSKHFRVIALDLKGFGDSDKPSTINSYRIELLVEELKVFILSFSTKKCNIIGHDLGGLLGWFIIALHSNIVDKFIAISSPHPNFYWNDVSGENMFSSKWRHFSRLPVLPEIDVLKQDLSIIDETFSHLISKKEYTKKNYVEAYKYTFSRREDWTGPINYYRVLPYYRLELENTDQVQIKTLLIVGSADPLVSLEAVVQSSEHTEQFNVKVIPGAKHFPHQENPQMVNEAIIKYLIHQPIEQKPASKSIMSSWLGSLSTTVKYGNQVLDAMQKRTNGVVNSLPSKVLFSGHLKKMQQNNIDTVKD